MQWLNEAWIPVREIPHHLPRERDAFVGRHEDLQALAGLLEGGAALVSVLGIGGTGKTRLVTHFGWTWLGAFAGGAWFCDLSEARSVDGIVHAVAKALDVPLGKDDPVVQLGHAIAGRGPCLVILDNFEQVARHAVETLGRWLDRAPEAQFVVTTREVLGLPGESALALAPLRPEESVELFVTRARQAKRDFVLTDADRPHVEALVKLLDRLPLAIELAAARVRVMPPKTLLQRMSERFKLLASTGGRHTRQATLRGALDWSWELLSPDEQQAIAQPSVFEGGFTLEAAEAVLALSELWPTDAVQALVDKSLVRRVSDERFDLLMSVQEYAQEKLDLLGRRVEAEARHGALFAALGTEEALEALEGFGGTERWRASVAELEQLDRRRDPLELPVAVGLDAQLRPSERADRVRRREGLATLRDRHHPRGHRLREALHLERLRPSRHVSGRVLAQDHLGHVEPGARPNVERRERPVVRHRVRHRGVRVVEQQQEPVGLVDLPSAVQGQQVAGDPVVAGPSLRHRGVAELLGELRAVDHVGEQQRPAPVGLQRISGRRCTAARPPGGSPEGFAVLVAQGWSRPAAERDHPSRGLLHVQDEVARAVVPAVHDHDHGLTGQERNLQRGLALHARDDVVLDGDGVERARADAASGTEALVAALATTPPAR